LSEREAANASLRNLRVSRRFLFNLSGNFVKLEKIQQEQVGRVPIFRLWERFVDLAGLIEKTFQGLGYELVDLELSNRGRFLRVFIDKEGGINVDDCAAASNQLSRLFAVEGVDYDRLEVSSPGLDRPLKRPQDFERFAGERAQVKIRVPINGRRKFEGVLRNVGENGFELDADGDVVAIAFADVEKARLVPNL
jgi:ribosome maturation factor RimP